METKQNKKSGMTVPAATRMSWWIASELHEERERAGISEEQVAVSLGVDVRTVNRLEKGATMGRDIDRFVAQYAYLCGLDDPREFWDRALARWHKSGSAPAFEVLPGPAAAFAEAIRTEALRRRRDVRERSRKRRASP